MKWLKRAEDIINGDSLKTDEAIELLNLSKSSMPELLHAASFIKQRCLSDRKAVCSIINVKSGGCSENCSFCAQSVHHDTEVDEFPFLKKDEVVEKALEDEPYATRFSIVSSGRNLSKKDVETAAECIEAVSRKTAHRSCASLGTLSLSELIKLKKAGLKRYHHNLETAPSFFSEICTTHTYEERIQTIESVKKAGLELCSGGIFGAGETNEQQVEFFETIKKFNPDALPLNFLVPIKGTPLGNLELMPVFEAVKIIALSRFMFPKTDIKTGGGRMEVFRDMQSLVFLAGANGFITGSLLTVKGRSPEDDMNVIAQISL